MIKLYPITFPNLSKSPNTDTLQEVITKIRKPQPIEMHVEAGG